MKTPNAASCGRRLFRWIHAAFHPALPALVVLNGKWLLPVAGLLLGSINHLTGAAASLTTATLLEDMTRLSGLAEFPQPAYTCRQFSSYDRASVAANKPNWFANNDCGQYLRVEERAGRKEYVMMDAAGPGVVVRIWSANPAGILRIYLDKTEQPVWEVAMADLLGGKYPGLPRPLAGEYSKGWNLYFPIPYAKWCKITSDQGNFYYHVNYRAYAADVAIESFRPGQITALADRIQRLAAQMAAPRGDEAQLGGQAENIQYDLPPGKTVRQEFAGPKAFSWSVLRVKAENREAALRGILVKITFDGEPCIEAPLGDLFGTAPGVNPYESLPLGMTKEGEMYSHWFMPFRDRAVIELVNLSASAASLSGLISLADFQWTPASMHFHAKWRAEFDVRTRPMQDWNYLTATGRGVFVGAAFSIDNPVKDWWGEGDEKIYVDGESFPSHFGTGTEDYYGYAWCWPALFTHAYHAQPRCDGPGNYGRTSVNRFHILDRIPFTQFFKFDMELWHWNEKCQVNMAVVAYWYAAPGSRDGFKPIRAEDAVVRPMPVYVVPRVADVLEGEELKIVRVTGTAEPQDWDGISGGKHLWWHTGMNPGDTLQVAFPAPKAGRFQVFARFLSAPDYGVHQLAINGQKTGAPMDFFNPEVKPSEELLLGTYELKPENNTFTATIIGANDKAIKSYMLGLDYLRLKAVETPGQ